MRRYLYSIVDDDGQGRWPLEHFRIENEYFQCKKVLGKHCLKNLLETALQENT